VAARIAAEIGKGTWGDWLPGERALAQSLQTSRKTIRKALAQLQRDGAIKTQHGLGHAVVAAPARGKQPVARDEA
jgi:LacI family transcriptional regulator